MFTDELIVQCFNHLKCSLVLQLSCPGSSGSDLMKSIASLGPLIIPLSLNIVENIWDNVSTQLWELNIYLKLH